MKTTLLTLLSLCSFVFGISQTHTYQFNGVLTEAAAAGPTLTQVLDATCTPAGANGSFNTEIITTSVGNSGTAKPVFLFNQNAGLSYANGSGLGITGTYTIHIFVRKTDFSLGNFAFQKVIDFSNGTNDNGLYTNFNGGTPQLDNVYSVSPHPTGPTLTNNQYYLITLVRNGGTNALDVYLDGTVVISGYNDAAGDYLSNGTNPIIFFRDDVSAPATFFCESGPGAVRYISLQASTSTALQVNATWLSLVSTVLPVRMNLFTAQKNNTDALLQWQTASEPNIAYFDVQKSYDGLTFSTISKVNANGISSSTYSYNDAAAFATGSSNTYYRIKMVENNGNFKYSYIVRVANGRDVKLNVFPNPATDIITISGLKTNDMVKLLSIDGKVLVQQTSGVQSMTMNIGKYKPGTYILQVQNDQAVSQQKIIKY